LELGAENWERRIGIQILNSCSNSQFLFYVYSKTLSDKSIIVTGAGSGLGLAMAAAFASFGARV
jgi:hypothetical protein